MGQLVPMELLDHPVLMETNQLVLMEQRQEDLVEDSVMMEVNLYVQMVRDPPVQMEPRPHLVQMSRNLRVQMVHNQLVQMDQHPGDQAVLMDPHQHHALMEQIQHAPMEQLNPLALTVKNQSVGKEQLQCVKMELLQDKIKIQMS